MTEGGAPPSPLASFPLDGEDWGGVMRYGPLVADERALRLLGNLSGRRVLLLGVGAGQPAAALAEGGAKVIALDPTPSRVEATRRHCTNRGVSVEVHQRELAELANVRAETIDLTVSIFALAGVANLTRVFRQVHRVLRPEAPLVLSLPHPMQAVFAAPRGDAGRAQRAYGETEPLRWSFDGSEGLDHTHTIEGLVTALSRAGFQLDTLLEPLAASSSAATRYWQPAMSCVPAVLIARARKVGL